MHLTSQDQLPSGLVAQLGRAKGDLFQRSQVRTPPGSEIFSLSLYGPILFLGLMLKKYYLGIFIRALFIVLRGQALPVTPAPNITRSKKNT